MKRIFFYLCLLGLLPAFIACDKAPDGIIKESVMEKVLVDLTKADVYVSMYPGQFPNDSARLALKQSVLASYGLTLHDLDTSLVWYGHHLEIYDKVLQKATDRITDEINDNQGAPGRAVNTHSPTAVNSLHKVYPNSGDTANVWSGQTTWMFTGGMKQGMIPFDMSPSSESQSGDRYTMELKSLAMGNRLSVLMAADYSDGTTSIVSYTFSGGDGWKSYDLQTDSARIVKRVYGKIGYQVKPGGIAFVDSIQLIRTHFDRQRYSSFNIQKLIAPREESSTATATAPALTRGIEGSDRRSR